MLLLSLKQKSLVLIYGLVSVKLLARLWLQFSNRMEQKFCHNFKDYVIPTCDCFAVKETTSHFLLCCQFFANERQKLYDVIFLIDTSVKDLDKKSLIHILLYGSDKYGDS